MHSERENKTTAARRTLTVFSLGSLAMIEGVWTGAAARAQLPYFYPTAEGSHDLAAADFDRDGRTDLAVSSGNGQITVLFNDGDGRFTRVNELETGGGDYIVAGDVDRDHDMDLVTADGTTIHVLLNDGTGQFSAPVDYTTGHRVYGLALGDVTGNAAPDIFLSEFEASTGWCQFLLNDGRGTFSPDLPGTFSGRHPAEFSAVTGDFDGDGDVDAVMMTQDFQFPNYYLDIRLCVLLNNGNGTQWTSRWQMVTTDDFNAPPMHLAGGDFDGDGDLDLILNDGGEEGGEMASLFFLANDGRARFSRELIWTPTWDYATGACLADVNGDGRIDAVAIADLGFLQRDHFQAYALITGESRQRTIADDPNRGGSIVVKTPDLNGDGMLDLVAVVSTPESGVLVTLNRFAPHRPVLAQSPLVRGQPTTFEITGALPNERAWFLYSLGGMGMSTGIETLGGLSIDLASPTLVMGSALTDASGVAHLVRTVPVRAPADAILATQAVVRRGPGGRDSVKTNFITMPIH